MHIAAVGRGLTLTLFVCFGDSGVELKSGSCSHPELHLPLFLVIFFLCVCGGGGGSLNCLGWPCTCRQASCEPVLTASASRVLGITGLYQQQQLELLFKPEFILGVFCL